MNSKQNIRRFEFVCLVSVIILLFIASCATNKASITGFAVLDASANETSNESIAAAEAAAEIINETQSIINETASINETAAEELPKEKKEKEEKPKENTPPVWKSDVSEFILNGKTAIDLNNYFSDKENDTIAYTATAPENIKVEMQNNLAILTPTANNF